MKKILCLLLAAALCLGLMAGCGSTAETAAAEPTAEATEAPAEATEAPVEEAEATEVPEEAAAADTDYTTGSPWLDPELPGNVTEETEADLKDNFALAVNKEEYISTTIPAGYNYGGTVNDLVQEQSRDMLALFQNADPTTSHDAELCVNLYNLLMDWDARNELGMEPVLGDMETIRNIDSLDALSAYFTETAPEDIFAGILSEYVDTDLTNAAIRSVYISGPSLLLGDSNYYREETDSSVRVRQAYTDLMLKVLVKAGYDESSAQELLDACLEFETKLAAVVYTSAEKNSPDYTSKINNPMTVDEADALCGAYPLKGELQAEGLDSDTCIVTNPDALRTVAELYTEENLESIKAYLLIHGLKSQLDYLDRECYELMTECNNTILGSTGMKADETVATSKVSSLLAWPAAHMYSDTYVTAEEKAAVNEVIDEIIAEYRVMLSEETFISEATREYAVQKLDNLTVRCLYPDDWSAYGIFDSVDFDGPENGGTLKDALRVINRATIAKQASDLQETVDREIWPDGIYPNTVNCFYNPSDNSINILGAFARGTMYSPDMSKEELLGSLGVVIGHEISHAFDSTGAQFDADGNYSNWWTDEDYAAFTEKTQRIADYFSAITPWEGQAIDGSTLTGEACADMGGMACVLRIASGIENVDYDALFTSYARVWLTVESPLFSVYRITQDTHPLCYLRINCVLQQFDEFLDCYGITEGDGMYLAEADRVTVW